MIERAREAQALRIAPLLGRHQPDLTLLTEADLLAGGELACP